MSKIVVLTGSPRKKGNSNSLADSFCNEARLAGHKITRFDTTRLKIGGLFIYKRPNKLTVPYNFYIIYIINVINLIIFLVFWC